MSIEAIAVRRIRKSNTVYHVSRYTAMNLRIPSNIISVEYDPELRPEFDPMHSVLALVSKNSFFDNYFDDSDWTKVAAFVERHLGENIIVHCEMGQVRSRSIAEWIAANYPQYTVCHVHERILGDRLTSVIYREALE